MQSYNQKVLSSYQAGACLVFPHAGAVELWRERLASQLGAIRTDRIISSEEFFSRCILHPGKPSNMLNKVAFLVDYYAALNEKPSVPAAAWISENNRILPELASLALSGDLGSYEDIYYAYKAYLEAHNLYEGLWERADGRMALPEKGNYICFFPELYGYELPDNALASGRCSSYTALDLMTVAEASALTAPVAPAACEGDSASVVSASHIATKAATASAGSLRCLEFEHAQAELSYASTWIRERLARKEEVLVSLVSPESWISPLQSELGIVLAVEKTQDMTLSPVGTLIRWIQELYFSNWSREAFENGAYNLSIPWGTPYMRFFSDHSYFMSFTHRLEKRGDEYYNCWQEMPTEEGRTVFMAFSDAFDKIIAARSIGEGYAAFYSFVQEYAPALLQQLPMAFAHLKDLMDVELSEGISWLDLWLCIAQNYYKEEGAFRHPYLKVVRYPEALGAPAQNHIVLGLDENKLKMTRSDIIEPYVRDRMPRLRKPIKTKAAIASLLATAGDACGLYSPRDFGEIATKPLGVDFEHVASREVPMSYQRELAAWVGELGAEDRKATMQSLTHMYKSGFEQAHKQIFTADRIDFTKTLVPEAFLAPILERYKADSVDRLTLNYSFINSFVSSGFSAYISSVLKLPTETRYGSDARSFAQKEGTAAHNMLEYIYGQHRNYKEAAEAELQFAEIAVNAYKSVNTNEKFLRAVRRIEMMQGAYKKAKIVLASLAEAYPEGKIFAREYAFSRIDIDPDLPLFRGRIDHIGIASEAEGEDSDILIIDYKRSDTSTPKKKYVHDVDAPAVVQIPVYLAALRAQEPQLSPNKLVSAYVIMDGSIKLISGNLTIKQQKEGFTREMELAGLIEKLKMSLALVQDALMSGDFRQGELGHDRERVVSWSDEDREREISRSRYVVGWKNPWE